MYFFAKSTLDKYVDIVIVFVRLRAVALLLCINILLVLGITGQRFALREGGRTVGAGVVSKVIS